MVENETETMKNVAVSAKISEKIMCARKFIIRIVVHVVLKMLNIYKV